MTELERALQEQKKYDAQVQSNIKNKKDLLKSEEKKRKEINKNMENVCSYC